MASRRGPDNSVRIAVNGTINAQPWTNVFHAQLTTSSAIAQADLDTWLTSFQTAYKTRFAPSQGTATIYALANAVCYTPGGGELVSQVTMTGTGSAASGNADNATCAVISWLSGVYWRGGKPRTYLCGIPSTNITNATTLTNTFATSLQTAAAGFRTDVNALTAGTIATSVLGFVSFRTGNVDRIPAVFFAYTGARVHPRLGTQRRRLGRWQP